MNITEIFEHSKNKTRIYFAGEDFKAFVEHVILFSNQEVDFVSEDSFGTLKNDFVLYFEKDTEKGAAFFPNVVFIPHQKTITHVPKLLKSITGGGILIYPEEHHSITNAISAAENYFRKITFLPPNLAEENGKLYLQTDLGVLPLYFQDEILMDNLEGLRIFFQQLGVMEEDFYEALLNFSL